jgi:hypothetical protein
MAAIAGGLSLAAPASAADVFIYSATLSGDAIGTTVPAIDGREAFRMSPFVLEAKDGAQFSAGQDFTALAFCVDFYTDMPMEAYEDQLDGTNDIDAGYADGTLAGATAEEQETVFRLVDYGAYLYKHHSTHSNVQTQLAAIQGAIWQVVTHKTFTFYDSYLGPEADQLIQDYANLNGVLLREHRTMRVLVSQDGFQGVAYSLRAGVPEPATWGLMIGGFFVAGGVLRRARRRTLSAA